MRNKKETQLSIEGVVEYTDKEGEKSENIKGDPFHDKVIMAESALVSFMVAFIEGEKGVGKKIIKTLKLRIFSGEKRKRLRGEKEYSPKNDEEKAE